MRQWQAASVCRLCDEKECTCDLKTEFIKKALLAEDPFAKRVPLASDLQGAVEWIQARSCEQVHATNSVHAWSCVAFCVHICICWQVNAEREQIMSQIEAAAEQLHVTGATEQWFQDADSGVKQVCLLGIAFVRWAVALWFARLPRE